MLSDFTQEEGKSIPQNGSLYSEYLDWLIKTYGNDKAAFIHYLHRYYHLTWDEYWLHDEENRWRMAYRILDRLADIGGSQLPIEVEEDLEKCPPELVNKFCNYYQ
ncbi:hypothetical protein CAL7716_101030 (plasmid) [Calothrix sp. PCC 7716]|nr:hypothetical protein CAL7716_101030 [Calothrix sp. PCC 7716]